MLAFLTTTPMASGLGVPSARFIGPLPMKIVKPLPVKLEPDSLKLPEISSRLPKFMSTSCAMKAKLSAALTSIVITVPLTVIVSVQSRP